MEVRILLDRTWYVRDDNRELVDRLAERAAEDDLPIDARLVEPRARFETIHTKGVIVDERRVLIGSANWNNNSVRNNRELALVLEGEEIGAYYTDLFEGDWRGGRWLVPIGFAAGVLAAGGAAVAVGARTIRFEG